ncbi:hypothetical protein THAOC_11752 [Thalassiosira oceanica]|uniref:Uncharacterized protein n=1 Tax=Thalassiosira oceanica TaxID=159749 RepID=K0SQJ8_THAOC|nr:hypothetical protein THAOC_11752 [Thalassiosira oceanica]|eukprot:EJK67244.1 hypothetical protein THAOC_11752 [Thalassiosira oceanica]
MHRRSSICPLRCARDPVTSSFSGVACHFCGPPTLPETEYRGFGRPLPLAGGDGPGGGAARFAMMSSVETAATGFNDSVGRSRETAHASTVTKVPTKTKKNEQNHGAPRARRIAPQPRASIERRLATSKVDL